MSGKRRIYLMVCLMVAFVTGSVQLAHAQDEPPPSTCLPTDPDYDPRLCVPIDGGLAFLLAAGVGYGLLKNRPVPKKQTQKDSSGLGGV